MKSSLFQCFLANFLCINLTLIRSIISSILGVSSTSKLFCLFAGGCQRILAVYSILQIIIAHLRIIIVKLWCNAWVVFTLHHGNITHMSNISLGNGILCVRIASGMGIWWYQHIRLRISLYINPQLNRLNV